MEKTNLEWSRGLYIAAISDAVSAPLISRITSARGNNWGVEALACLNAAGWGMTPRKTDRGSWTGGWGADVGKTGWAVRGGKVFWTAAGTRFICGATSLPDPVNCDPWILGYLLPTGELVIGGKWQLFEGCLSSQTHIMHRRKGIPKIGSKNSHISKLVQSMIRDILRIIIGLLQYHATF